DEGEQRAEQEPCQATCFHGYGLLVTGRIRSASLSVDSRTAMSCDQAWNRGSWRIGSWAGVHAPSASWSDVRTGSPSCLITVLFQYGAVGCHGRNRMRQNVMQTGRNDEDRLASFATDCGARQAMDASGLCRALARLATFSQVFGD